MAEMAPPKESALLCLLKNRHIVPRPLCDLATACSCRFIFRPVSKMSLCILADSHVPATASLSPRSLSYSSACLDAISAAVISNSTLHASMDTLKWLPFFLQSEGWVDLSAPVFVTLH